ncbi:beta-ketoacyl synthase N-terminal-like domain-containing protein [Methylosinus sp. Ce-a6]|uniref:polyketide synthase family protein n=1 Tax=Methylosinus sp. Ce-a6 TaxID=2172005 RepID=UPI001FCEF93C|nr:beta-ketoacyl synthase N-terminal-like domain-containing protein [Methylosinus sp. Ce-a6]
MAAATATTAEHKTMNRGAAIAIVGMHGRFPGAVDAAAFWQNLSSGRDVVREVPAERWDWRAIHGDRSADGAKSYSRWGGFADHVDCFDHGFFGVLPKEAESMDPQQRLFLQSAHNALEDAGIAPRSLEGRKVGVFVGVGNADHPALLRDSETAIDAYRGTGMALTAIANRVSYLFDFRGPSNVVDTACSSSLVALHRAVVSLREGECELAIVGGVNLLLGPELYVAFSKAEMLSPTGRCRTLDAEADGYVRGEGVAAIVIRPLEEAIASGDYIYAVVEGVAENHGGRAHSFTAPNPVAQAEAIAAAWRKAGRPLGDAAFLEMHGTGTTLGDPVEIDGLKAALALEPAARGESRAPIYLASLKSQIGHLEAAAGIASLFKAVMALQRRHLPANLHYRRLNPQVELENTPFAVADRPITLERRDDEPLTAGVSSFGFGGVNAHVALREFRAEKRSRASEAASSAASRPFLFVLSGKDEAALTARVRQLLGLLRRIVGAPTQARVVELLGEALGLPESTRFSELASHGVTPGGLVEALGVLSRRLGVAIGISDIRDCVTLDEIGAAVCERLASPIAEDDRTRLLCGVAAPDADIDVIDLAGIARTLMLGRDAMKERLALIAPDLETLIERLSRFAAAPSSEGPWLRASIHRFGEKGERPVAARDALDEAALLHWASYWARTRAPDMAWDALYPDLPPPRKTPLPAYPFELRRIWRRSARSAAGESENRAAAEVAAADAQARRSRVRSASSLHDAWESCWTGSERWPPSSLTALPALIVHLAAQKGAVAIAEARLARPSDLDGDPTIDPTTSDGSVLQCVASGERPRAILNARLAATPPEPERAPPSEPIGSILGGAFYGLLDSAGLTVAPRFRCVESVAISTDALDFRLRLSREDDRDAAFWAALTATSALGACWLLDPALSADAFRCVWRVESLRFDPAAARTVTRLSMVRRDEDIVALAAFSDRDEPVLTIATVATRRFALPSRSVAAAAVVRSAS